MFARIPRAQSGHPPRACLPHRCYRTLLPNGAILYHFLQKTFSTKMVQFYMLVCTKNFMRCHRKIGAIWCN